MGEKMPLLRVKDVSFHYRSEQPEVEWAVRRVNLTVHSGETVAIIGPNGSGKSTLAKLIIGLLKPLSGEIYVDDLNPADDREVWSVRQQAGIVFQNPDNQIVAPTVQDDVAFGLENLGLPREIILDRVHDALERVGIAGMGDVAPSRLSGGQKQRLAIAGVLAMRPKLIVMDEATSMLDPRGRKEVADVVQKVKEEGVAVITVTHAMDEAWQADRVVVMAGGTVQLTGSPQDVFRRREELTALGLDVPFSVKVQHELIQREFPLTEEAMDDQSLVNTLWTLWQKT